MSTSLLSIKKKIHIPSSNKDTAIDIFRHLSREPRQCVDPDDLSPQKNDINLGARRQLIEALDSYSSKRKPYTPPNAQKKPIAVPGHIPELKDVNIVYDIYRVSRNSPKGDLYCLEVFSENTARINRCETYGEPKHVRKPIPSIPISVHACVIRTRSTEAAHMFG